MSIFKKQVVVDYSTDQMYNLVSDVDSYSKFIPLITSSKVIAKQDQQVRAAFKIAHSELGFEFTTVNTFQEGDFIAMNLEKGPFKSFKGAWRFTPLAAQKCLISFYLEFEFSNTLLCLILNGLFTQLCDSMISSFRRQAAVLYN